MKNNIVFYTSENKEITIEVLFKEETIWLNQQKIGDLFGVAKSTISEHFNNIFSSGELEIEATVRNFRTVQKEGTREVTRNIEYYNLDAIISVGYRVNSSKATKFRIWATNTLKKHILAGYTINPSQIRNNYSKFIEAVEQVKLLYNTTSQIQSNEILELVKSFAKTWFSLDAYDKNNLPTKGQTKESIALQVKELYKDVAKFKQELIQKGEATNLFANEKTPKSLESVFNNVFQTVFGEDAYPTIEEKASHLMYFIIKGHPFSDGNKRTGAFSFIWLLEKSGYNLKSKITPETLAILALFVAESATENKEQVIGLILLLLNN